MSDPIISPAPSPPSAPGVVQPQTEGGPSLPPSVLFTPIIPPPTIGDPVGVPTFPPVDPDTAPVPVPVGPQVGPVVGPAPVPPSLPGVVQPQFTGGGSPTIPASLFPEFTTTPPYPPIVFANVFKIGAIPPPLPSTPSQTPPPIVPSPVATIPQLPWPPPPAPTPPVNTVRPTIQLLAGVQVGDQLAGQVGTWTGASPFTYAREWTRNGSPIAGATAPGYTIATADIGAMIGLNVTATDTNGLETSMDAEPVGPVVAAPLTIPVNTNPPLATLNPTYILCTGGNWTPTPASLSYQWYAPAGTAVSGATGSTWIFAGHEGETAYCAVRAINDAGTSTPTNTNTVTIPVAQEPEARSVSAARTTRRKR